MMRAMLDIAHRMGVEQVELEYIEGNERARRLYDKMGFELVSHHPNAICLPDGTRLCEFLMIKKL